jgi:hypothetical protein
MSTLVQGFKLKFPNGLKAFDVPATRFYQNACFQPFRTHGTVVFICIRTNRVFVKDYHNLFNIACAVCDFAGPVLLDLTLKPL